MTEEQLFNEKKYQTAMSNAKRLYSKGVISMEEYHQFDTKMREKYRPILGALFSNITCYPGCLE